MRVNQQYNAGHAATAATQAAAQDWRMKAAKHFKHILEYRKDLTYYLVVSYDMARLYVVYILIYWFAINFSYFFTLFATFMICSILYIFERGMIITLQKHFDVVADDASYTLFDAEEPAVAAATAQQQQRSATSIKKPPTTSAPNRYTYDSSTDTVTYTF